MPGMGGTADTAGHAGHGAATPVKPVFAQPVQSVFDNYVKVQGALVEDSLQGLSGAGTAIAKAIQADSKHALPAKVAEQADALGKAKDLESARAAFKTLSDTLIEFVKTQKAAAGTYHIAYCPMAKASWLQTGTPVMNPYMGKSMPHCGQLKT
jgi:Cu(I)/Ag(I) efflux system membrane fusion protein